MKAGNHSSFLPQWTRRVAMEGSGRDPLGLSRVSDNLTGFLLPSIITTTDRARYFSFYTWAWADIQALKATATKELSLTALRSEFQRREAAFAVASFLDRKTDLPIVGIRQVEPKATGGDDDVDIEFPVLPSNQLGGFGQYYGGCLHGLELLQGDADGFCEVPTPLGEKVAQAFAAATATAPYLSDDSLRNKRRVPREVLKKSAKVFSLDGLLLPSAKAEREALIRMFFSLGEKPTPSHPLNRQGSLALFLHVLSTYESAGIEVPRGEVDDYAVYWPHYYNGLCDEEGNWHPYQAPAVLAEVQGFWRQFCAHQLVAYAIEEFLAAVLTVLSAHPKGLSEADLVEKLSDEQFPDFLDETLSGECGSPSEMLKHLGMTEVPSGRLSLALCERFSGAAELNEWNIVQTEGYTAANRLGRAVAIMAMLYGKWAGRRDDSHFQRVEQTAHNEFWLGTIFPWVESWLQKDLSWNKAVGTLLREIIVRHDTIKFQKRKLDASWLDEANGRFIWQQDLEPGFRASRHGNATTILQDLGLIEHAGLEQPLIVTARGREVLAETLRLRA